MTRLQTPTSLSLRGSISVTLVIDRSTNKSVRWTSVHSDQNLRGPRRAAAAAVDRYMLPAPDLSSKPAGRRCRCRSTRQTDGRTDIRPFYDAYRILCGPRNKQYRLSRRRSESQLAWTGTEETKPRTTRADTREYTSML